MKASNKNYSILIISLSAIIIFILFIGILWKIGFLEVTGQDSNAKIIAASIALIGGLFTTLITLIGLILKHSIDLRSIAIQERNVALEKDAEKRLNVEAAIQSIGLLTTSSGNEVPDIQKAGVILSLGNLKMFAMALSLSAEMIKKSSLSMDTYTWLIDKCMNYGDDVIKEQAVLGLTNHIDKLPKPNGGAYFPTTFLMVKSVSSLPLNTRGIVVDIIIDLVTIRSFNEWDKGVLSALFEFLYKHWKKDDTYIKDRTGIALYNFIKAFPKNTSNYWGSEIVNFQDLSEQFSIYSDMSLSDRDISYSNSLSRMKNILDWCQEN